MDKKEVIIMKEWTYKGVWVVMENYFIRVTCKVTAPTERIAAEKAFRWFMGYHKKSIPLKAHYIGMQLMEVK